MHSRLSRHQQRLACSTQMWTVLSFTGGSRLQDLNDLPALPPQPGEKTDEQRRNTKLAVEARARLRQAKQYSQVRDAIVRGHRRVNFSWTQKQEQLLELYDNGTLLHEANRLTRISSNGRLKTWHGTFLDIGGSTGDWESPDPAQLDHFEQGDATYLADAWANPK